MNGPVFLKYFTYPCPNYNDGIIGQKLQEPDVIVDSGYFLGSGFWMNEIYNSL